MRQKNILLLKLVWTLPLISLVFLAACGGAGAGSSPDPTPVVLPVAPPEGASTVPALITRPPATMRFSRIGLPEGLSQSAVNCILQDRQGFLWIGTQDGLNRFDGYSFKVYQPDAEDTNSISDRWINTLFQDSQGNLWIGTRQGGLNRYDFLTGNFTHYTHDSNDYKSLVSNRIQEIYEDRFGALWIGTAQGLDLFAPAIGGFIHHKLTETTEAAAVDNNILTLFEDSSGTLWIGTGGGLKSYSRQTNEFIAYPDNTENPLGLNGNSVIDIQENPNQSLWLATRKGLALFNPADGNYIYYQHDAANPDSIINNSVRTLYLDKAGVLWIGTNDGMDRLDPDTEKFIHYRNDPALSFSLSSNVITAIYESADNILWIGTFGGGINTYYRGQDRFTYYYNTTGSANSFSDNMIYNVYVDPIGIVWISTHNGGLSALNPDTGEITRYLNDPNNPDSLMSNEVRTVYKDQEGTLWVGSTAGLDRLDPGSDTFIHYRPDTLDSFHLAGASVNDILEDRHGNLWIATDFGLDLFNRQSLTFTHYRPSLGDPTTISGYEITVVFEDQGGTLWVGTFNDGLNKFTPKTGEFIRYQNDPRNPESLSNNSILSIFEDIHGNLWIGTAGGGLNLYNPGDVETFTRSLETDGLPNNVINCILQDELGYLWISTNNGISRFDIEGDAYRNFTASDGLQGNEFNMSACAQDKNGNLYFGGINGLTVFNPAQIVDSSFTPPIVLLSFTKDGEPIESAVAPNFTEEITIRWPWQYFEFEFAALSYAQPQENQYAYILENHDTSWHFIGTEHKGQYANLPGGEYTLRLIGSNSDGIWNETGHSVKITVIPPFWETWAFRATIAFAILALIYTAYRLRVKSVESYNRQLERQVSDRTLEIEQLFEKTKELVVVKERNRLARELHDSAKQKAFAALAQLGTANGILPKDPRSARNHLVEAENLVYQVIEELTFLIQEMYPVGLRDKGLATSLRDYIFEWESRNDIPAAIVIENDVRLPLEIEQAIYRVIQESLSNVARHSQATNVQVSLIYRPEMVESVIIDNGCGFDPQAKANGIGLRSIRERIESLGGIVEIASPQNCGTRVTIRVPLKPRED